MGKISNYAEKTTTTGADLAVIVDSATSSEKKVQLTNIIPAGTVTYAKLDATFLSGWITETATWTYASGATTNVGTFTLTGDYTSVYNVGDKGKFTQTTVKYFIITKVAVSGGTTTVTAYFGTDYTIANATITSPSYSHVKSPVGFPMDPAKWTVTATSSSDRNGFGNNAWASLTDTIVVPIGAWNLSIKAAFIVNTTVQAVRNANVTLSSDASSETNPKLTLYVGQLAASATSMTTGGVQLVSENVTIAASTTFTMMGKLSSTTTTTATVSGTQTPTTFRAVCAYL